MATTNKYNNRKDYEDDLNSFLEADFIEEETFGADGIDEEYYVGGEIDEEVEDLEDDDFINDIDFSQFKGRDFKSSLRNVNKTVKKTKSKKRAEKLKHKVIVPSDNKVIVEGRSRNVAKKSSSQKPIGARKIVSGGKIVDSNVNEIGVRKKAILYGKKTKGGVANTTKRIIVPSTQKVIVEGVDNFILGKDDKCGIKDIGYYKCKKLKELIFTMNNNSALDFNLELFNPSMPLDYLHSTSLNLNDKIQVSGGIVSYTDVLFNLLANPTHIVNAKFTFAGASYLQQINQPLIFKNKNIEGKQKIDPLQLQLQVDTMQVANDIVFFDILGNLNRPFIPDGMDVIEYKVLAGNTVTFAFYYEQKDLKKFFYKEARESKKLL